MPPDGNRPAGRGFSGPAAARPIGVGMHVQDLNRILPIELPNKSRPPLQVTAHPLEELPRSGCGTGHESEALRDCVLNVRAVGLEIVEASRDASEDRGLGGSRNGNRR